MATKIKILNPGSRLAMSNEFERMQGNPRQNAVALPANFAVHRAPPAARGATARPPKARAQGQAFDMLRVFFTLTAGANAQNVLPRASNERTFLTIRNSSASAGSLLVGFGLPPLGVETCDYELVAGALLILDYRVPQDDLWLFSAGGAGGSVSYGLSSGA